MTEFIKAELKGRDFFKEVLDNSPKVSSYMFTEDPYCEFDVIWTDINDKTNIGEIKYRENYSSTDSLIIKEGALIEKFKFDTIKSNHPYANHYYIMLFNDGVGYIWDMDKIEPKWFDKVCPKTSAIQSENKVKIVANLSLSMGVRFSFSKNLNW